MLLAAAASAQPSPFDLLCRSYAPYMDPDDPLALPLKLRSLTQNPYKFWRGSKDLFFKWCKSNASDWFADTGTFTPCHGDLHLGNIGSYACDRGWGVLALGMVDFDDSATLPFQIELLQGLISLRLAGRQNSIALNDAEADRLTNTLLDAYRVAEHISLMTEPPPFINSWCELRGESYQVSLMEPWSKEMDPGKVKTVDDLLRLARIWGIVAGSAHRKAGHSQAILLRLTPALSRQLQQRCDDFIHNFEQDFAVLKTDWRTARFVRQADAAIRELAGL